MLGYIFRTNFIITSESVTLNSTALVDLTLYGNFKKHTVKSERMELAKFSLANETSSQK